MKDNKTDFNSYNIKLQQQDNITCIIKHEWKTMQLS